MKQHLGSVESRMAGRTLTGVARRDEYSFVLYFADGGRVVVTTEGDCCSDSAFYGCRLPESETSAFGKVLSVEIADGDNSREGHEAAFRLCRINLPGDCSHDVIPYSWSKGGAYDSEDDFEVVGLSRVVIRTTAGDVELLDINNSNGYYSSDFEFSFEDGPES